MNTVLRTVGGFPNLAKGTDFCQNKSKNSGMSQITKPLDLIKLSIGERVYIKCRGGRELEGLLHAFDSHMNMVLEDVEETVTTTDIDEETEEELVQSRKRTIEMLFVRGDVVILVSPPLRVA